VEKEGLWGEDLTSVNTAKRRICAKRKEEGFAEALRRTEK
jgi:hypothetical protein